MVLKVTVQKKTPKQSLPKVTSDAVVQMFFKIGVLRKFAVLTGKHLCWSDLQLYLKETSTQVFSCDYCKIFTDNSFYRMPLVAAFVSLIK